MPTRYEKVSVSLKKFYEKNGSPVKGKPGRIQDEAEKKKKSESLIRFHAAQPKKTEAQKKAANKANVYAYRARKRNAIPPDADLKLIKQIYECCPAVYHVDHRIALAVGGPHHQDNLQYLPVKENCRKGKNGKYDESLAIQWSEFIPLNPSKVHGPDC